MENFSFSIIITTKNRYRMLLDELSCLTGQAYKNFRVYIVDDNSSDETKNINLTKYNFYCEIFHSKDNLNMVRARNKGLSMAEKSSDYFMILDDDNQFKHNFLEQLNCFVNKYPDLSLFGLKNYNQDRKSIWWFGCNYNISTMLPHFIRQEFNSDFIKVDSIANCLLIKRDAFYKLGYFNEKYVLDLSETEFCFRFKKAGYPVVTANVPIFHQSTDGIDKMEGFRLRIDERPETFFYTFRNKFLIVSEFGSLWNKLMFYCLFQFISLLCYFYISIRIMNTKLLAIYFNGFLAGNMYIFTDKLLNYESFNGKIRGRGAFIKHNANAHNKVSKIYNSKHSEIYNPIEQNRLKKVISDMVVGKAPLRILDVGAGTGNLTLKFLDLDCDVTAADVSVKSLELLRQLSNNNKRLKTVTLTDAKLPLENNFFDIATTYSVLHHIPDYLFTIQEMLRVTKTGGLIYIDHEHNDNKWLPTESLNEYYNNNKRTRADYLKMFYQTGELFTFEFIKEVFIRIFLNKRYQKEGDIHVWPDDHINWDKIKEIILRNGHKILVENDYLLYRPEVEESIYNRYKDRCNDIKCMIIQK